MGAGAHPALNTAFEGTGGVRREGTEGMEFHMRMTVPGKQGVLEGVCPSERDHQLPLLSSCWPGVGFQGAFPGMEINKTIVT